ncbi:hypothetical protein MEO93_24640 [Dolichospermum sp. ST_sed3]|nr:hypothetical protein [Dolichospermum sp. ST_sed3]
MEEEKEIKYCICAMIDLLGFSNHLEISSYDLRTSIGKQAVSRLENIEKVLEFLEIERESRKDYYPPIFHTHRINDAIFLTMDLDEVLLPSIGHTKFGGLTANDLDKFFKEDIAKSEEQFHSAVNDRISQSIETLLQFIGFIARLHLNLNKLEGQNFFPGAKTVIATGFRRPFLSKLNKKEDFFSANFALSNAYLAEKTLKGSSFYVDNGILQLISFNKFARNILRFSHYHFREATFDCLSNHEEVFYLPPEAFTTEPIEINLFRKDYKFIMLNPSPLTYLQNLPRIMVFLIDKEKPDKSNIFYNHIYDAIKKGINRKTFKNSKPPRSFIFNGTNDFSVDIGIFYEFLSEGKSMTREELKENKFDKEHANLTEEGKKKMKEFLDEEVEIDLVTIKIDEHKDTIFNFSEEILSCLKIMLEGNVNLLDYKDEYEDNTQIK